MEPVISAWVHYSQLTCQQLQAKKKKKKEKTREMRNAVMDMESKHILWDENHDKIQTYMIKLQVFPL